MNSPFGCFFCINLIKKKPRSGAPRAAAASAPRYFLNLNLNIKKILFIYIRMATLFVFSPPLAQSGFGTEKAILKARRRV
jgi:hypothetical protein